MSKARKAGPFWCAALGCAMVWLGDASAQSVVGCFVNGRQVADSMCQPGGGTSAASSPNAAMMGAMGNALGTALGTMLRNSMSGSADGAAEQAARQRDAEEAARQQAARQQARAAETQRRQTEETERQREFSDGQQRVLEEVRSLGADTSRPETLPAQSSEASPLAPRQLETSPAGQQSLSDLAREVQAEDLRDSVKKKPPQKKPKQKPDPVAAAQAVPKACILTITYDDGSRFYECIPGRGDDWKKYCLMVRGTSQEPVECNTSSR
jgi:hypothetical protein